MEHRLPYEGASVSSARRLVGDFAEVRLPDRRLDELVLMASEVVTNAVKHGDPSPMEASGYSSRRTSMVARRGDRRR